MELGAIRERFAGHEAELIRPKNTVTASVLVPIIEKDGELHVVFEKRESHIPQGGEICFPGGHAEAGETPAEAAVRETSEELLIPRENIELLAPLHILPGRGIKEVHSFLGFLHDYRGGADPHEVEQVFSLSLSHLLTTPPKIYKGRLQVQPGDDFPYDEIPGGKNYPFAYVTRKFYFYDSPCGAIWGLTAEMLYQFIELLKG